MENMGFGETLIPQAGKSVLGKQHILLCSVTQGGVAWHHLEGEPRVKK